jgi:hypothetical protein
LKVILEVFWQLEERRFEGSPDAVNSLRLLLQLFQRK